MAQDATKQILYRDQLLLRRRGLLNSRGLTMSCMSARCCRQMHKDLHSELDQIFKILIPILEPSLNKKRPQQLVLVEDAAKAACETIAAQAVGSGRLVVAQLVTELVVAVLSLPKLPTVVMDEVKDQIPERIGMVPTGSLKRQLDVTIKTVWAKLHEQFWTTPPGESVTSSPLGKELASLSNDLVHAQTLAPVS